MEQKEMVQIEKIGNKLEKLEEKLEQEEELTDRDLSEEIADMSIFQHFAAEYNELDQAANELDQLYDQVKEHYDAMLNNRQRGTLNFVQGQTSNLISLKTAKIQLLREKINVKRNVIDYGTKKQMMKKDDTSSVGIAMEIMRQLINSDAVSEKPEIIDIESRDITDELDEEVKRLEESGEIVYSESEMNPKAVLNVEKTIRQIISADPNDLKDNNNKNKGQQHGNLNPLEYMEQNMESEYAEYQQVLDNFEEDDTTGLDFDNDVLEEDDNIDFEVAVGVSTDRQKWKFIAVSPEGEFIENENILAQLPDSDVVEMRITRVNGEIQALLSDGSVYPVYVIDFED